MGAKTRIPKGRKDSEVRICPPAPNSLSRKLRPCFRERTRPRSTRARPPSERRLGGRPPQGVSGEAGGPTLGDGRKRTQKPDTREANGSPLCPPLPLETRAPGAPTPQAPSSRSPCAPLREGAAPLPPGFGQPLGALPGLSELEEEVTTTAQKPSLHPL